MPWKKNEWLLWSLKMKMIIKNKTLSSAAWAERWESWKRKMEKSEREKEEVSNSNSNSNSISKVGRVLCKRCKQTYNPASNSSTSCRFHPSFFVCRRHDDQKRWPTHPPFSILFSSIPYSTLQFSPHLNYIDHKIPRLL